jgi:TRAP-type transport system small permease protein
MMLAKSSQNVQKAIYNLSYALTVIGIVFLVVLCLIAIVDILMRRILHTPLAGSLELSQLTLSMVFFTSLAYCAVNNGHIIVDTLIMTFNKSVRRVLQIVMHFLSLGTLVIVAWQLFLYAAKMYGAEQSTAMLGIPIFPVVYVAAISTTLLALVFLVQFISLVAEAAHK